ncbi:MAG: TrkA family potassium uptake protein [Deltaproteobacteria bacterium]|nr:MAG: TrkA family potassium uptake protein [Deltaproteobacteria bacterium]
MKRVVVIGLGIFGFNLAKDLFEAGLEVIAVDKNKDLVQKIRDFSTKAVLADATEKEVMEAIGFEEDDVVIVSFGEDLAASTILTLHLKEMKVKTIIVKVPNEDHKRILEKVGATEVVIPEREMAAKIARSLISPNVMEYIPLTREYTICEIAPPASFIGKSIAEIQLRKRYNIGLLASRDVLTNQISVIPGGDFVVRQ